MDDAVACANLKFTGADNLIWASDYPHSVTTWPNSKSYIDKQMAPCTPEERAKLIGRQRGETVCSFTCQFLKILTA